MATWQKEYVHGGRTVRPLISPRLKQRGQARVTETDHRSHLQAVVGELLCPTSEQALARQHLIKNELRHLAEAASWSLSSKTYQPESTKSVSVSIYLAAIPEPPSLPEAIEAFWGKFSWAENPWIPDEMIPCLKSTKYNSIQVTSIEQLKIVRAAAAVSTFTLPAREGCLRGHTVAKLHRWMVTILLTSPRVQVGEQVGGLRRLQLRDALQLSQQYTWTRLDQQTVQGEVYSDGRSVVLEQQTNGIGWRVRHQDDMTHDEEIFRDQKNGLVVRIDSLVHGYRWEISTPVKNHSIVGQIKKRITRQIRAERQPPPVSAVLTKWRNRNTGGAHQNMLTDYQV
ncbi:hypothetical protein GN244_ATG18280 [Phytophthora infestans]|uniref:Uncharacterized protein n=1 Tax=Phytophthora infestans TaxID=4787 RepID=A0A833S937_PHYIN|nr:hypothetical protein GN244_ATG18280 [Phytophthora infestans]